MSDFKKIYSHENFKNHPVRPLARGSDSGGQRAKPRWQFLDFLTFHLVSKPSFVVLLFDAFLLFIVACFHAVFIGNDALVVDTVVQRRAFVLVDRSRRFARRSYQ